MTNNNSGDETQTALWTSTAMTVFIIILKGTLQLLSSPWDHFSLFENWLELTLIILGLVLLGGDRPNVGQVATFLSSWELLLLIAQHPRMSSAVETLKIVICKVKRFLFLVALLVLCFALVF